MSEFWKELFDYGTPIAILAAGVWILIRVGKWGAGVFERAIFNEEKGWLANVNRNTEATEKYLKETAERDKVQQQLCEQHAQSLREISTVLRGHLEISKSTLRGLEQFRKDAEDPSAPFSTVETNREISRIKETLCHMFEGAKELAQHVGPEIGTIVQRNCDKCLQRLKA